MMSDEDSSDKQEEQNRQSHQPEQPTAVREPEGNREVRPNSYLPGLKAGVTAFVAGYVLLYLLKGSQMMSNFTQSFSQGASVSGASMSMLREMGVSLPEKWQVVGWGYHIIQQGSLSMSLSGAGMSRTFTVPGSTFNYGVIGFLIPIAVLIGAGYLIVSGQDVSSQKSAAVNGATVAAGYLPLALVTAFLFSWSTTVTRSTFGQTVSASVSASPALLQSILFVGILYPVICGGIGGIVAFEYSS